MALYTRFATEADALYVAKNIRDADRNELRSSFGLSPEAALLHGVRRTHATSIVSTDDDHAPLAIYGVSGVAWRCFEVWMLGTDALRTYKREFLRKSRSVVREMNRTYGHLANVVDSRNVEHIRWLKWCGFRFPGLTVRLLDPSVDFYRFELGDPDNVWTSNNSRS